jgi:hypothetical protein
VLLLLLSSAVRQAPVRHCLRRASRLLLLLMLHLLLLPCKTWWRRLSSNWVCC